MAFWSKWFQQSKVSEVEGVGFEHLVKASQQVAQATYVASKGETRDALKAKVDEFVKSVRGEPSLVENQVAALADALIGQEPVKAYLKELARQVGNQAFLKELQQTLAAATAAAPTPTNGTVAAEIAAEPAEAATNVV